MSFILDALKKAEEERKKIERAVPFRGRGGKLKRRPFILPLLVVLLLACLGVVFFFPTKAPEPPKKEVREEPRAHTSPSPPEKKVEEANVEVKRVQEKTASIQTPVRVMKKEGVKKRTSLLVTTKKRQIEEKRPFQEPEKVTSRDEERTEKRLEVRKIDMEKLQELFNQAVSLSQRGEREEAKRMYRDIIREKPDHIEALNNLALLLSAEGNKTEALLLFGKILEIKQDYPKAYNNIAIILLSSGETRLAEEYFRKAIEAGGGLEPSVNLANLLRTQKRYEEAERVLEEFMRKGNRDPSLLVSYALLKDEKGNIRDAIRYYRAFLRESPPSPEREKVVERLRYLEGLEEHR